MSLGAYRSIAAFLGGVLPLSFFLSALPARAASALAAWTISRDGVLKLRTSRGTQLRAFYQPSERGKGDRVWIDFPGELVRPRALKGSGPVREIRLGKPMPGFTRLVVEFRPSVVLDPSRLKLVGISEDRWKLRFEGISTNGLRRIGEGNLESPTWISGSKKNRRYSSANIASLPVVPRGRYTVVIDPGHGGPDPGAVGIGSLRETDVVLDVSKQVSKILQSKGVQVRLTRTNEIDLDLPPRVALANRSRASAFVSIHANASRRHRPDVSGIETFYYSGWRGKELATFIQNEVLKVSPGSPDRGVRQGRFFVIRRTTMPAALVEIGFVTGRLDASRLVLASHRKKIAFAISKGILNFLKKRR